MNEPHKKLKDISSIWWRNFDDFPHDELNQITNNKKMHHFQRKPLEENLFNNIVEESQIFS